ncbi:MAG: lysylphosphatidylglycerol synthase transmembrane domain-containing protein [Cytophagales bacterium]
MSFVAGGGLIWYTYRNENIGDVISKIKDAHFEFILLSFLAMILSHIARAYRWNQLYQTMGFNPGTGRSFLAVMFGYFMNLAIPRAGEISRCAILRKTDKIPLEESIGTVVAERAFDLLTIIVIVALAFLFNYELFNQILSATQNTNGESSSEGSGYLLWIFIGILSVLFFMYLLRRRLMRYRFFAKIGASLQKVGTGIMSIKHVENKFMFLFNTVVIWVMYFLASYVVFFAIPATSHLGLDVALTLLIVSTMAMIVPVPAGSAYPLFVQTALTIYGVSTSDGKVYATVMYGSTVLMIFIIGGISFLIAAWLASKSE